MKYLIVSTGSEFDGVNTPTYLDSSKEEAINIVKQIALNAIRNDEDDVPDYITFGGNVSGLYSVSIQWDNKHCDIELIDVDSIKKEETKIVDARSFTDEYFEDNEEYLENLCAGKTIYGEKL